MTFTDQRHQSFGPLCNRCRTDWPCDAFIAAALERIAKVQDGPADVLRAALDKNAALVAEMDEVSLLADGRRHTNAASDPE